MHSSFSIQIENVQLSLNLLFKLKKERFILEWIEKMKNKKKTFPKRKIKFTPEKWENLYAFAILFAEGVFHLKFYGYSAFFSLFAFKSE